MANNGEDQPAQNAAQNASGENATPNTQGPARVIEPVSGAEEPQAKAAASGSGDFPKAKTAPLKAPMPTAGSWPQRLERAHAAEAGTKSPLAPPYEPDKKPEGELGKSDYAALGPAGAMASMIAVAAKDSAGVTCGRNECRV